MGDSSPRAVAAAADLHGGPLLDGIFVNETAWNDWLIGECERLSERATGAMVQQGASELGSGDAASALRRGRRAVELNAFREDAHRLVLRALAETQRTTEAIKYFQDLAAHLKQELDAEPNDETRMTDTASRTWLHGHGDHRRSIQADPTESRCRVSAPVDTRLDCLYVTSHTLSNCYKLACGWNVCRACGGSDNGRISYE
jgi:DNA-binding SARP family transcriptional activator